MKINAVSGELDTNDMGFTLMHEHFLVMDQVMRHAFVRWFDREAYMRQAIKEANEAKACGVRTIVDMTPINLGRDVTVLREIAERTGMQIIAATGFYWQEAPWFGDNLEPDRLADILAEDIEKGIQGTGCRAGIIKCATHEQGVTPVNLNLLKTAARLHRRTGVPIYTHTFAKNRTGLLQQDVFASEGVDLGRVVIGHCDDSTDADYLVSILSRGSYVGFDKMGLDCINPLADRINMLADLCRKGWENRILLSHDYCVFSDYGCVGSKRIFEKETVNPAHNLCLIARKVLPALLAKGITDRQIRKMTVDNPRSVFDNA